MSCFCIGELVDHNARHLEFSAKREAVPIACALPIRWSSAPTGAPPLQGNKRPRVLTLPNGARMSDIRENRGIPQRSYVLYVSPPRPPPVRPGLGRPGAAGSFRVPSALYGFGRSG